MRNFLNNEKGSVAGTLISIFMALLVGIIVLNVSNSITDPATNAQVVINESWNTSTGDVYVQLGNGSIINTSEYVGNSSYTASLGTNYSINNTAGTILAVNEIDCDTDAGLMNHTLYNISYQYLDGSYISSGSTRTLVRLIPTVMALILFVAVAAVGLKASTD